MKEKIRLLSIIMAILLSGPVLTSCHTSKKSSGGGKPHISADFDKGRKNRHKKIEATRWGQQIVDEAYTWLGTPYAYSRADKGVATDCSGMVLKVYEKIAGIKLPRNSAKQAEFCKSIKQKDVKIGDLVFFATGKSEDKISHVGIMLDDKNFIHASASKGVVISDVTQPYYVRTFRGYGRVEE